MSNHLANAILLAGLAGLLAALLGLIGAPAQATQEPTQEPDRIVVAFFNAQTRQLDALFVLPEGAPYVCPDSEQCIESLYHAVKDRSLQQIEQDLQRIVPDVPPDPPLMPKIDG